MNSIRVKILKYFLGFSVVLLVLIWLFQIVFLNDFYRIIKEQEVKSYVSNISKNEEPPQNTDVCFIKMKDGKIDSSSNRMCIFFEQRPNFLNTLYKETLELNQYAGYFNDKDSMIYGQHRPKDESFIFAKKTSDNEVIIATARIMPITSTISTLVVQLWVISIIMIILIALLVTILSKKIIKPLEIIKDEAIKIGENNHIIKEQDLGYYEVNEISKSLSFASRQLSKVDNLQNEFISNITHDLKTPLTIIEGYAQMMIDIPNENNVENAKIITEETQKLSNMVNDILELSKIKAGKELVKIKNENIDILIKDVISSVSNLVKKEGYTIEYNSKPLYLNIDNYLFKQAFYNLLVNAIHYTGEDKKIVVEVVEYENIVHIIVIDSGEGIDEKDLPFIFDRYYGEEKLHRRALFSTGIGLSIVKRIMQLHNGKAFVETSLNGSKFYLEFNKN